MSQMKILNSKEVKHILGLLYDQFGYDEKPAYCFLLNRKNKIYVVSRDVGKLELEKFRVDTLGMYFGTLYPDHVRLSVEGSQIVGPYADKMKLQLRHDVLADYLKGMDLTDAVDNDTGLQQGEYYIVEHQNLDGDSDFLGCVKVSGDKLLNFISKARRLKVLNADCEHDSCA